MNILIYGLPTSGKTTFAEKLVKKVGLQNLRHINADKVREAFGDWEFTPQARQRQALRMAAIGKMNEADGFNTIVDFVCPFNPYREMPQWDMTIWVNTIEESPYEDTNKAFEEPLILFLFQLLVLELYAIQSKLFHKSRKLFLYHQ